jgi:hypothetical protein
MEGAFKGENQVPVTLYQVLREQDSAKYERLRDGFLRKRLSVLESRAQPTLIRAKKFGMYEGFLHPKTEIEVVRHDRIPGFCVDDEKIYTSVLDHLRVTRAKSDAVQKTIDNFFRINHQVNSPTQKYLRHKRREQAYAKKGRGNPLSLSEIREQYIAVCVEKAAVAQNLISFLGDNVWMIDCFVRLERYDGAIDEGQHGFNIIENSPSEYTLYDPNHPFEIRDEHNEIIAVKPALFHITPEEFSGLARGEVIEVIHKEIKQYASGKEETILRSYRYGVEGSLRKE